MGPSDSLPSTRSSYLFPAQAGAHFPCFLDCRASQVPGRSFGTRCLLPPRRVHLGVSVSFFPGGSGFILYGSLTTLDLPFEAVSEFAFATARTFAFRGSGAIAHAVARSVGYMSLILFYMANSFHLARTPRLHLARHKRHPCHLFRFSLDQASLRAGKVATGKSFWDFVRKASRGFAFCRAGDGPVFYLAQSRNFGGRIAKDRDDPAGLSVDVDECPALNAVVTFPADGVVSVCFLEVEWVLVPIAGESGSKLT